MEHFKAVYDLLSNDENAIANFAPQLGIFQRLLDQQKQDLEDLQVRKAKLIKISEDFKKIGSSQLISAQFEKAV